MKKLLMSILALVMIVAISQAQDKKEGPRNAQGRQTQMMADKLNFTEEQKNQLKKIHDEFREQMAELNKNENITVKEFKAKREAIQKQHRQQLENILTADQKKQMQEMRHGAKSKHHGMHKDGLDKMKTQLNLTDDQVNKLKASHESFSAKMKSIRENSSLTDEQKKEQMKALGKEEKQFKKSVLTKEQLEKMKELKGQRRQKFVQ